MKIKIPFLKDKKTIDYRDYLEGLEPHCPGCDIISDAEMYEIPEGKEQIEKLLKIADKYQNPYEYFFSLALHYYLYILYL